MKINSKLLAVTGTAFVLTSAQALPLLQLDIGGGTYVGGSEESTIANASVFNLYALFDGSRGAPGSGTYYISAAISPRQDQSFPAPNVGTFTVNGVGYSTANMNYGIPPLQVVDGMPGVQDLGAHAVFPTYYAEFAFTFGGSQSGLYNTATDPGDPLSHPGTGLFYQQFLIDVSGLLSDYSIHFDLYDTAVKRKTGAYTLDSFAPFSHDAQSGPGGHHDGRVPDGGATVALLGLAFAGLGAGRRLMGR
jgi:hypothetical protein